MIWVIIVAVLCAAFWVIGTVFWCNGDWAIILAIILSIALVIMLACVLTSHINPEAKIAYSEATKEAIVYQLENKTWENDNNIGASEVFSQAGEYNATVKASKISLHNPWTSWLYGNFWDELTPIDLNAY